MYKNVIIICLFCTILVSCGKKADPEYKANKVNFYVHMS